MGTEGMDQQLQLQTAHCTLETQSVGKIISLLTLSMVVHITVEKGLEKAEMTWLTIQDIENIKQINRLPGKSQKI